MHRTLLTAIVSALAFSSLSCAPVDSSRQRIGPTGGSMTLRSGLTLDIPQGALTREVEVHVRDIEVAHGEHEVEIEPKGLDLMTPGTLTVNDDGRRVEALELEHGLLEVHHRGGRIAIRVDRFGHISLRRFEMRDGGDDHGGLRDGGTDDSAQTGDDHGGLRDGGTDDSAQTGDDHGGLRDGGTDDSVDHGGITDAGSPGGNNSCVDNDACPCGSECVFGTCTAVVTCRTDADCAGGATCREGRRHGQACGVLACHP